MLLLMVMYNNNGLHYYVPSHLYFPFHIFFFSFYSRIVQITLHIFLMMLVYCILFVFAKFIIPTRTSEIKN